MIISSLVETRTGHLYQGRYKAFLVEDAGRAQRSANLVQLFNLTGTDRVANRVRRAERATTNRRTGERPCKKSKPLSA